MIGNEFVKPQSTQSNSVSLNKKPLDLWLKFDTENGSTLGANE